MAIDAGIYQAITPRLKTVADFDREAQAMEAAQQQQAMRGLEMQAAQQRLSDMDRQRQRGSQLRDLLGQGAGPQQLRQAGFLEEARDEEKFGMERQRGGLEIQAKQLGLLRDSNKMVAERFRNLLANPQGSTPQQAIQTIAEMRRMGVFAPVAQMQGVSEDDIAASMVREIPPEPGAFASWLRTNAMQAMDFDKTLPQVERLDAGNEHITRLRDPITGQVIREERTPKAPTPDAALRAQVTVQGQQTRATGGGSAPPTAGSTPQPASDRVSLSAELGVPVAARDPWSGQKNPDVAMRQAQTQAVKEIDEIDAAASQANTMAQAADRFMAAQNQAGRLTQGPIAGRAPAMTGPAQAMDRETALITPQMRQPGSGATSDFDAQMFMRSTLNRTNRPEVNQVIADGIKAHAELLNQRARFMQDYLTVNGHLNDAGRHWSAYLKANPIFDPKSPESPRLNQNRVPYQQFFQGGKAGGPARPAPAAQGRDIGGGFRLKE